MCSSVCDIAVVRTVLLCCGIIDGSYDIVLMIQYDFGRVRVMSYPCEMRSYQSEFHDPVPGHSKTILVYEMIQIPITSYDTGSDVYV